MHRSSRSAPKNRSKPVRCVSHLVLQLIGRCEKAAQPNAYGCPTTRDSFWSAAKNWLILATLEEGSTWPNNIRFAVEPQGGSIGESETNDLTPAPK